MLRRLFKEDAGQGMIEYGLIIVLIAVVLIGIILAMNGQLKNIFGQNSNTANNQKVITKKL
jgi:pilus assembly protein Flp/PilA